MTGPALGLPAPRRRRIDLEAIADDSDESLGQFRRALSRHLAEAAGDVILEVREPVDIGLERRQRDEPTDELARPLGIVSEKAPGQRPA